MLKSGWSLYPLSEFGLFTQEWDTLNSNSYQTPLLESHFVTPLLKHFSSGKEKLAIYYTDNSIQAMAIVVKIKTGCWSTFQPSQAPIGCWLQKSDLSTEQLSKQLGRQLMLFPLVMSVTQQDPELLSRPTDKWRINTLDYIATSRISVKGSFEEYWQKCGKNLRKNLHKQRNRLARNNITPHLKILTAPIEIRAAAQAYCKLESAGWKYANNTAVSMENAQGPFYIDMLDRFAQKGKAIVFQYWHNDQLAATDLCIIGYNVIVILKTTYDETITHYSPALLMKEAAFEYLFKCQQVERIEFYGKVMEWHTKVSNEMRTMYHINTYSCLAALIKSIKQVTS